MGQGISTRAFRLNRAAPVPLYHQLAEYLRQQIEQGPWQPGDFFTTEEELQKTFQVSRATVRRALQQLMAEGLLERITGGTFIALLRCASAASGQREITNAACCSTQVNKA